MKTTRRRPVSVNTGSMADIAFLLLIFFLVSTTISADKGILRQLPPYCDGQNDCTADLKKRNVLLISINQDNEIMISDKPSTLEEVIQNVKEFIDNNGLSQCDYCFGQKREDLSEHPTKAVISLQYNKQSLYDRFIAVQNEIAQAYYELRHEFAMRRFKKPMYDLSSAEIKIVKQYYPIKISELVPK